MVSVDNLCMEFTARPLLTDVSFVVNPKDRIALVGKNGAGKSTLLRILAGELAPTGGSVARAKGISIAYLPQVMTLSDERTVIEEAATAFAHIRDIEADIARLQAALETAAEDDMMDLVEQLTHAQDRYDMLGGQGWQAELERTLTGLGFRREDFHRPTNEFSGGWRMRIELAKLLLGRPDVLLLDEPTNHLDIGSIQWLEQFLRTRANAVIVVSHDRAFINNVTTRTIEITCGRINDYRVPYNQYVQLRDERRQQQLRAYANQQRQIAEARDFIERFRYKPTKSNQVQSRVKMLERIVPVEVDEVDTSRIHLRFPPCQRSGDFPLICDDVRKAYGPHEVFSHVSLTVRRGEKVAFVGNNGEGKSTLVKCIMGETDCEGDLRVGHNVQIGYFAQNQAQLLDGNLTVLETVDYLATGDMRTKLKDLLGAFMFPGEDVDKYVRNLSGGERSRLAMVCMLLSPVNFLILDEPTNHLDMPSKDVLKQAIQAFDGTAIIVSHDRDFLDNLVSRVYEFNGGRVREHIGGIYDFLEAKRAEQASLTGTDGNVNHRQTEAPAPTTPPAPQPAPSLSYAEQKELARQLRKAEKAVEQCEAQMARLDDEIHALQQRMSTPEGAADATLFRHYSDLRAQSEALMTQWEAAEEAADQLRGKSTNQS